MSKRVAIGIDLGTTNCCVGVYRNGRVEILENNVGSRLTPSYVAFDDQDVHIGEAAREQSAVNAKNTIFEVKRLLGRRFDDPSVQDDIKQWPYEVFNDQGAPKIRVQYKEEQIVLAPEQVSAMLLQEMKAIAEKKLGNEVYDAVITVPAYFSDSQRQATIDAGKIAGLNVLSILNEPTAAAIAYGLEKNVANKTILVFDLGGGTFDVAVLSITGNIFEVKSVGGDTHLGGSDFDLKMNKRYQKIIHQKTGKDLERNERARGRLRSACETAKVSLSSAQHARIVIDCLFDDKDFDVVVRRNKFEEMCSGLFARTIDHVIKVLDDACVEKNDIDDIILVGGSSRIPKVKEILSTFFDGKKLNCTINPDEAVAYGAAMTAAMFSGESAIQKFTLQDVVPLSLGMEGTGDRMMRFIKRNTQIPKTVVQPKWTTSEDYQEAVTVKVYEGEEKMASKNNFLGTFEFHHGEREKAGVPSLTFTFTIDANGILNVSAANEKMKQSESVAITGNKGRLSRSDIEQLRKDTSLLMSASSTLTL